MALLCGCALFAINALGEAYTTLPFAELILAALMFVTPRRRGRQAADEGRSLRVTLALLLTALALSSDLVNGADLPLAAKDTIRIVLLFLPALLYAVNARSVTFLGIGLGFLLAYEASSLVATLVALAGGGGLETLKYDLPSPGLLLVASIVPSVRLPRWLRALLFASAVLALATALAAESRNAVLSIGVVIGCWLVITRLPRLASLAPVAGASLPWLPVLLVWTAPTVDFLLENGLDTASNLERSMSLLVSRDLIAASPWTGSPLATFHTALSDRMHDVAGLQSAALDPHNFYMQVGVAFGLPALAILTLLSLAMFAWASRSSGLPPWLRVATIVLLATLAAITPLSNLTRFEWLVLWMLLLAPRPEVLTLVRQPATLGTEPSLLGPEPSLLEPTAT